MHMIFSMPLKIIGASWNFHRHYHRQTKILAFLPQKHALSSLLQVLALSQTLRLLEHLLLDNVQDSLSNSSEDRLLDQSAYVQIYLCMTKIHQSDNFQYVQLSHYIVAVPRQTCLLSSQTPFHPVHSPHFHLLASLPHIPIVYHAFCQHPILLDSINIGFHMDLTLPFLLTIANYFSA